MFIAEVYADILRHLPRDDLDTIQLCDRRSSNVVKWNFGEEAKTEDKGPRRVLYRLSVRNGGGYEITRRLRHKTIFRFDGEEELVSRMKFALVESFSVGSDWRDNGPTMDERLLNVLMPLRGAWKTGHCRMPRRYSSPSVLERTLDELLLCDTMHVGRPCQLRLHRQFLSYDSVQQCRSLILEAHYHLDTNLLLAWLHRANQWNKPIELLVRDVQNIELHALLEALKESFAGAIERQKFVITITSNSRKVNEEILHNGKTSERLQISQDGWIVRVERLPAEQK